MSSVKPNVYLEETGSDRHSRSLWLVWVAGVLTRAAGALSV